MAAQVQEFNQVSVLRPQLTQLNRHFEQLSAEEILQWVSRQFSGHFTLACAFGPESIILVDMLSCIQSKVDAFFLDTGYHFAETLALVAAMQARYPNLELRVIRPELSVAHQDQIHGPNLFERDPDLCCALRKVEPLERALAGYDCWLSGLRREQSPTRAQTPMVVWDWQRDMLKVNPLVRWTKSQIWGYILEHKLPYNHLHNEGYPSIGCAPCTKAVAQGEEERSGRWQGTGKRECGIHL